MASFPPVRASSWATTLWEPHHVGSNIVTKELFRDYCTVLNDGYNSWHARSTKEAGGAQFLQRYENQPAELARMNWERTVRGSGVVGDTSPSNAVTWKDVE